MPWLALAADSGPRIDRVDPPNWWIGLSPQPLLLVAGGNLSEATLKADVAGIRVAHTESSQDGRYLFVWLEIDPGMAPTVASLTVHTRQGSTQFHFPLEARRDAVTNFRGLSEDDCFYLIMPDRFADGDATNDRPPQSPGTYDRKKARAYHGGDLQGIRDHLPYLHDLGITALWLTPVYDNDNFSPQDYHGYGAVNYYAVDEHLGTLRDLQELVAAAHRVGIKVFLDQVPNHSGPRHPWVAAPPSPDWFHGTPEQHLVSRGRFDSVVDPHALARQSRELIEGWFAGILPDLNQENPRVEQYLIQNSLWWAEETGLDGFRLDTFPYVSRSFWAHWHKALFAAYPRLSTIGEVFDPDVTLTSFFAGGQTRFDGIDSGVTTLFDFPLAFALHDVILRGAPAHKLVEVLERDWLYPRPQLLVTFFGNHDVPRFISLPGSSKEKLKLAEALLLTLRGVPQLYYGDEIGMAGGGDPDNRRDFPGGFPDDPHNAFNPQQRTPDEQEIFSHVQTLLRLRRTHAALRRGRQWHLTWDESSYAFLRELPSERLLVVLNNSDKPRAVNLNFTDTPATGVRELEPLFAAKPAQVEADHTSVEVGPRSVAIYQAK